MAIYLGVIIIIMIYSLFGNVNKNSNTKKCYLIVCFGLLTVVAMLRKYTIGTDLNLFYAPTFEQIKYLDFSNLFEVEFEGGYVLINKIISLFCGDVQGLIVLTSCFIIPVYGVFIYKNSEKVEISTMLFVLLRIYFMTLNIIRQEIAVAIILIAYEYIKQHKNLKAIILILLATSMHTSAIICLALIPLYKIKFTRKTFLVLLIIAIITMLVGNQIIMLFTNVFSSFGLSNRRGYENYFEIDRYGGQKVNIISIYTVAIAGLFFIIGYIVLIFNKRTNLKKNQDNNDFLVYLSYIYFIITVLTLKIAIVNRLSYYVLPFTLILIPRVLSNIKKRINKTLLFVILLGIMFFTCIYILVYYADELYGIVPYEFFWE